MRVRCRDRALKVRLEIDVEGKHWPPASGIAVRRRMVLSGEE